MKVFRGIDKLPKFKNAILTIGTFDGVHLGHQSLLKQINDLAKAVDGESVLLTFDPHPRLVINPDDTSLRLINTLDEKIDLLQSYGIDNTVIAPFSKPFSQIPAIEYIKNFLVTHFSPHTIVIGYDHHFGLNRSGNISLLREFSAFLKYEVIEIDKQTTQDLTISSTSIRKALDQGDVKLAQQLLGHPFSMQGYIVKGDQLGRTIGFPTANIKIDNRNKLIPKTGSYACWAVHAEKRYPAMINIGFRPTFKGDEKTIEAHIIDFDVDIYGEPLKVELVDFLRPEKKFESQNELSNQLSADRKNTLNILQSKHA